MKFKLPLLAVADIERAKAFYKEVLGLGVVLDFGENVTLTGGISLQTMDSWQSFIGGRNVRLGGNDAELYFEEEDLDSFLAKLEGMPGVELVHPVHQYGWGQRVVRFYDPDGHIIEVGESMRRVVLRFLESGMTVEETVEVSQHPLDFVLWCRDHPEEDPPQG